MKNLEKVNVQSLWIALVALVMLVASNPLMAATKDCAGKTCAGETATICYDQDNDTHYQGDDQDKISMGQGNDKVLIAGASNGAGKDYICGDGDNDELRGGTEDDILRGNEGDDECFGNGGNEDNCVCDTENSCEI